MERISYINHFKIVKFEFLNHHAAGVLQDFERPCIGYILKLPTKLRRGRVFIQGQNTARKARRSDLHCQRHKVLFRVERISRN